MEEIGFNQQPVMDISQLITLVVFVALLGLVAFWLRKKQSGLNKFTAGLSKGEQICEVRQQKVDTTTRLIEINYEGQKLLVLKTGTELLQLKVAQDKECQE